MSSLSNFAVNIYIARTLGAAQYGAFALAYMTYGFALNASRGLGTDPLLAWGVVLLVALPRGLGHLMPGSLWRPTYPLVVPSTLAIGGAFGVTCGTAVASWAGAPIFWWQLRKGLRAGHGTPHVADSGPAVSLASEVK
jgi:hypothetical protein